MSQENVDGLLGGYAAFARGDFDGALAGVDDQIEWTPGLGPLLGVETLRGREAIKRMWTEDVPREIEDFTAEALGIDDLGEQVLIHLRYSGRGRASGARLSQEFFQLYAFRDGKAIPMREFTSREATLAAAAAD